MRRTRPLLLLVIILVVIGVGATYYAQKAFQQRHTTAAPKSLPSGVSATASRWQWSHTLNDRTIVEVAAQDFRQIKEPSVFELDVVELKVFHKDSKGFDLVKSAKAVFDIQNRLLSAEGDVEIAMGIPLEGERKGRLLNIRSSGVTFDSSTGRASTDKPATFTFDEGDGKAVGASYDPSTRELHMASQVELNWRGRGPKAKPMKVQAGELSYREADSKVILTPWSKLERGTFALEGGNAFITLDHGAITLVEAENARGTDKDPRRSLEFAAPKLELTFGPHNAVEKIMAGNGGRLVASSPAARTTAAGDVVQLLFNNVAGESVLNEALAMGHASVESSPVVKPGAPSPETRILKSDTILAYMREGGKEMDRAETQAPGTLDFIPTRQGRRGRRLEAERMYITYGEANHLKSFRAATAATRTDPDPARIKPKQPPPPQALTWSKDLSADFDPKTGQMRRIEQSGDFRYEEGDRKARAERATLESPSEVITLSGKARVWDANSSVTADRIVLDQKTGDMTAEGGVASARQPDSKAASSPMLDRSEPMRATAARMTTSDNNLVIVYEGNAVMWQGANRIAAPRIAIDRDEGTLEATGGITTQFLEKAKPDPKNPKAPPRQGAFTEVRAESLVYTDETRLAHYKGGARMTRPGMQVGAAEIRAWLKEKAKDKDSESSLDRAQADGKVEIHQQSAGRKREGRGEHADYQTGEERIVLHGGDATFTDSAKGTTKGGKLTWWANNDRLLVDGIENRPAESRLLRK